MCGIEVVANLVGRQAAARSTARDVLGNAVCKARRVADHADISDADRRAVEFLAREHVSRITSHVALVRIPPSLELLEGRAGFQRGVRIIRAVPPALLVCDADVGLDFGRIDAFDIIQYA